MSVGQTTVLRDGLNPPQTQKMSGTASGVKK